MRYEFIFWRLFTENFAKAMENPYNIQLKFINPIRASFERKLSTNVRIFSLLRTPNHGIKLFEAKSCFETIAEYREVRHWQRRIVRNQSNDFQYVNIWKKFHAHPTIVRVYSLCWKYFFLDKFGTERAKVLLDFF